MTNHRFINWLSSNQHETNSRFSRDLMYQVLIFRFLHYTTLVNFYFMFCTFTLILRLSFIKIDQRIPLFFYWNLKPSIFLYLDIHVVSWRIILYWPRLSLPFSTNYFHFGSIFLINRNFVFGKLLILRLFHLILSFKI